jgi:predicted PurR-regulated permease PerM
MAVTEKRVEQIIQIVAIVVLVIGCFMVLRPFLAAILSAAILCFSTWPVYEWLERKLGGRNWLAALVMTLLMALVLVLPLIAITLSYADEVPQLVERAREMLSQGLPEPPSWVSSIPLVGEQIDTAWRDLAGNREKLAEMLKRLLQPARQVLVYSGFLIGEGAAQFTLIAFVSYFFYRDGAALVRALRNALNRLAGDQTGRLLEIVGGTINGVVYGIVGTGIAQGIAALVGFLIAGVPGAPMLAFVTCFLSIIPAGPVLIWLGATAWLHGAMGILCHQRDRQHRQAAPDQPGQQPAVRAGAAGRARRRAGVRLRRHLPGADPACGRLQSHSQLDRASPGTAGAGALDALTGGGCVRRRFFSGS